MKKKRKKQYKKNRVIATLIISLFVVVIVAVVAFQKNKENVYSKIENVDEQEQTAENIHSNNEAKTDDLNNSGYLKLEDDPNADDALEVFHRTESLLKGEKQYPVRDDGKKVAYLTFDDGPSTTNTPGILDILKENNIKATFFIMGKQAESSEEAKELLKREAREGHAIGNHTYSHNYDYLYPNRTIDSNNFWSDVQKCNTVLKDILGEDFSTRVVRFPGGYWSWNGRENIRPIIDQNNYAIMDWNALSKDAEGKKKNADELVQVTKETVEGLGPNADSVVILMHDTYGKEETVKSLQRIIDYLRDKGFEFRTMK